MSDPKEWSVSPVLPVRDVAAALEHYSALGFRGNAYEEEGPDGPVYGFLCRDGIELHLACVRDLDPAANTSAAYLFVGDAEALHRDWRAAGAGGRLTDPQDTPYGLREFAHVDPDGNLLRVGSPMEEACGSG